MALYTSAVLWEKAVEICHIPRTIDREGITCYMIEIKISSFKWEIPRRYRQFVELHEKMTKQYGVNKNLLPPKKILGNRSESFIFERRKALELYLQSLIYHFKLLPEPLALFLEFQKYEVRVITAKLSEKLFFVGDEILTKEVSYKFSPIHLHAITERLKLEDPTCYSNDARQDIAHLMEFVTQLKRLKIVGSSEFYEDSNIIPNSLPFDLSIFKALETLEVFDCNLVQNLHSVGDLRIRIKQLIIGNSLADLSDLILCEILHWSPSNSERQLFSWSSITYANFSHNSLEKINACIELLTTVKKLDLSFNRIQVIENLESLSDLSVLVLSHNKIQDIESLHTRLGNIRCLNLGSNKIEHLHGLSKLFSLSELYLDNNLISSLADVFHLSKLPCLEILNLQNNPVTETVDYRSQVLLLFGALASEIVLDGNKATEKEIDTVSVLQALNEARGTLNMASTQNNVQKELNDKIQVSKHNFSYAATASSTQIFSDTSTQIKLCNNNPETSKFRQQVEFLRKTGGTDWLRLFNEMHLSSNELTAKQNSNINDNSESVLCNERSASLSDDKPTELTSELLTKFTSSNEISYPEWLMFLDSKNQNFKEQLFITYLQSIGHSSLERNSTVEIDNAKVLWIVILKCIKNSLCEIPACIFLLQKEIVFFHLKKFSTAPSRSMSCVAKYYPQCTYYRSLRPQDILSFSLGPCNAYLELNVKSETSIENVIILVTSKDAAALLASECHERYKIETILKSNPFLNNMLDMGEINIDPDLLPETVVEKQIIFSQRVCVSKVFHKCHYGILHYVFVTPSHVVLVEEKLYFPGVLGFDNLESQFQIHALINISTNVEQIHLKDIDYETDCELPDRKAVDGDVGQISFKEDDHLDILYKCGSWLIMEFKSSVSLYLNFFNLKQRNEFLDAFLSARNKR